MTDLPTLKNEGWGTRKSEKQIPRASARDDSAWADASGDGLRRERTLTLLTRKSS